MKEKSIPNNQRGAIAVLFAFILVVLIGFTALVIDIGRPYLAKAKLKEAADAAALAGVQAYGLSVLGNCTAWETLAQDVARENFPDEYLGCSLSNINIIAPAREESDPLTVQANLSATCNTSFAGIFGIDTVTVGTDPSTAERVPVEIMLVLDRSASMSSYLNHLKVAAKSLVDFFECSQDVDKIGLVTFSTGVKVPFELQNDFIIDDRIKTVIDEIVCKSGPRNDCHTNMEDALDQADDDTDRRGNSITTFTKYAPGTPPNERVRQFVVFFTDGMCDSFRGDFTRNGQVINSPYGAVVPDPGGWMMRKPLEPCDDGSCDHPVDPERCVWRAHSLCDPWTGLPIGIDFMPTGDGKPIGETQCKCVCDDGDHPYKTTRWHMFDPVWNSEYGGNEDDYSIDGYSSPYCNIPPVILKGYVSLKGTPADDTARKMTRYHARMLKEQGIRIYCIMYSRLGTSSWWLVDFLKNISSGEGYYYKAGNADSLRSAFNHIVMDTKKYVYLVK